MSRLLLTFYADDFTGSTDALEQLALAGVRAALFIEPPTAKQLARYKNLQAIGVAGKTRSLTPNAMERELLPALKKLKALGPRHIHYKVCSTFDSSPKIGSIGRVMEIASELFGAPVLPILAAAPALGRYTVFGNHFALYGIGTGGEIHRLDRHPSISKHPVTPMTEADLRAHLAKQTRKTIALFNILKLELPEQQARAALDQLLASKPDAILFDGVTSEHILRIGGFLDLLADRDQPLFSIGSSGIEAALTAHWRRTGVAPASGLISQSQRLARRLYEKPILVGSGSCSPITSAQIAWALKNGFSEVPIRAGALISDSRQEAERAIKATARQLNAGRSVIVHTTRSGSKRQIAARLKARTAKVLGAALGEVLRGALAQSDVQRICIAGGDTSSFAARALGIECLEMIAPLTPGAPLCRACAPGSPIDGREVVFKGGQVGAEDYFGLLTRE